MESSTKSVYRPLCSSFGALSCLGGALGFCGFGAALGLGLGFGVLGLGALSFGALSFGAALGALSFGALSRAFGSGRGALSARGLLAGRAVSARGSLSLAGALACAFGAGVAFAAWFSVGRSALGRASFAGAVFSLVVFSGWLAFSGRLAVLLFGGVLGRFSALAPFDAARFSAGGFSAG